MLIGYDWLCIINHKSNFYYSIEITLFAHLMYSST